MKKLVPVLQLAAAVLLCSTTSAAPGDENWENFPLPPGLDGPVSAMTTVGKNLYVAGDFKNAGAVAASGLASWNGQQWTALLSADDFFGSIYTLASDGRNLIVGGTFTISSVGATNIAKWNGASWERLGDGLREECRRAEGVFALATKGKLLYAGGKFSLAGSVAANNVAVWDGQQWAALGAGIGRTDGGCAYEPVEAVQALAIQGNNLLAGGRFHTSGSLRVTNIAAWDGRSWSGVGGGIAGGTPLSIFHDGIVEDFFGQVGALLVSGGNLYAGGSFRTAGNATATNIALW